MESDSQNRVLAILKVSPPVTGATAINELILNGCNSWERGTVIFKTVSYAKDIQDLGSIGFRKFSAFFRLWISVWMSLIRDKPKLVYIQMSITGMSFYRDSTILLLAKLFRKKIMVHLHGKGMKVYANGHFFYRFWMSFILKNQYAIVLTNSQKSDVDWIAWNQLFVLANGIEHPPLEKDWEVKSNVFTWMFLSNLLKAKGIDDVLELARTMHQQGKPFRGIIVGKEGDRDAKYVKAFIEQHGLQNNLEYHGPLYGLEKWKLLVESDVFLFPTYNEAFGLVGVEAMSVGLPVIAYEEGGLMDIIENGHNGFLVPKGDQYELLSRLEKYMTNPGLAQAHGLAGRRLFFVNFTSKTFKTRLFQIWEEVLEYRSTRNE